MDRMFGKKLYLVRPRRHSFPKYVARAVLCDILEEEPGVDKKPVSAKVTDQFASWNVYTLTSALAVMHDVMMEKQRGGDGESIGVSVDLEQIKTWITQVLHKPRDEITIKDVDDLIVAVRAMEPWDPKTFPYLPDSLAMTSLVVVLTGIFIGDTKTTLTDTILKMNGTVFSSLTTSTNIVISTYALSRKTIKARLQPSERPCTVVLPSWVEESSRLAFTDAYFYANTITDRHLLPLFHHVTYAISESVSEVFAKHVREAFNNNGASEVPLALQPGIVICRTNTEPDYMRAVAYGAYTATPAWNVYCAFAKRWFDMDLYKVKGPSETDFRKMEDDEAYLRSQLEPINCQSPYGPIGSKPKGYVSHGGSPVRTPFTPQSPPSIPKLDLPFDLSVSDATNQIKVEKVQSVRQDIGYPLPSPVNPYVEIIRPQPVRLEGNTLILVTPISPQPEYPPQPERPTHDKLIQEMLKAELEVDFKEQLLQLQHEPPPPLPCDTLKNEDNDSDNNDNMPGPYQPATPRGAERPRTPLFDSHVGVAAQLAEEDAARELARGVANIHVVDNDYEFDLPEATGMGRPRNIPEETRRPTSQSNNNNSPNRPRQDTYFLQSGQSHPHHHQQPQPPSPQRRQHQDRSQSDRPQSLPGLYYSYSSQQQNNNYATFNNNYYSVRVNSRPPRRSTLINRGPRSGGRRWSGGSSDNRNNNAGMFWRSSDNGSGY